jgi:rhodanese-related sulfurtransferase
MDLQMPPEIEVDALDALRRSGEPYAIVDVREPPEVAVWAFEDSINVPMSTLPGSLERVPKEGTVVVVCQIGMRSLQVTAWLHEKGYAGAVNFAGGVDAWLAAGRD